MTTPDKIPWRAGMMAERVDGAVVERVFEVDRERQTLRFVVARPDGSLRDYTDPMDIYRPLLLCPGTRGLLASERRRSGLPPGIWCDAYASMLDDDAAEIADLQAWFDGLGGDP